MINTVISLMKLDSKHPMLFLSIWIPAWDMQSSESVYTFLLEAASLSASGSQHRHPWRGLHPHCCGMPSPSTGAHRSPEQGTDAVCSATLTEHHSHRDHLREVETDFSGSTTDLIPEVLGMYLHTMFTGRYTHSWESDHTHPSFTGSIVVLMLSWETQLVVGIHGCRHRRPTVLSHLLQETWAFWCLWSFWNQSPGTSPGLYW